MINVKELSDKELIKLYKKNSSKTINILMILNAKENIEIVCELKKRGLFKNLEDSKKIDEEIAKLNDITNKELEEENRILRKEIYRLNERNDNLKEEMSQYLLISAVVCCIDKGEYLRKRDFDLSYANIEELDDLYTSLIKELQTFYKTSSIKTIDVSDIIDFSCKYLDRRYNERELDREEAPVEGMKYYY